MNPEFYSLATIVDQWCAGAQGNAGRYIRLLLELLAEEENQ